MSETNQIPADRSSQHPIAPTTGLGPAPEEHTPTLTPSPEPTLEKAHEDFALFQEGYVRSYIALADAKATLLFGAGAGLITYLFSKERFEETIFSFSGSAPFFLYLTALVFLSLSTACAALVIVPRLTQSGEGLIFFGAVSAHPSAAGYLQHVAGLSASELTAARIKHCYDVSKTCVRKYNMLRRSFLFGGLAAMATLVIVGGL